MKIGNGLTLTDDPEVECPKCGKTFVLSGAFEYGPGGETRCPECDALLECVDQEPKRSWSWKSR